MRRATSADSRFGRFLIGRNRSPLRAMRRSVAIVREAGWATLWFKVFGETCYRRIQLFERDLREPIDTIGVRSDIELGTLGRAEIDACLELRPDRSPEELHRRLARGGRCFVARHAGRVVAITWVSSDRAWSEYLDAVIEIEPDDAYLYEVTVHPDFRGRRIAAALFAHAFHELGRAGVRRVFFAVNFENRAALRALSGNGARVLGTQGVLRFGAWRHDFFRPRLPTAPAAADDAHDSSYWDRVAAHFDPPQKDEGAHEFLGSLKRRAYRRMLERWATARPPGPFLKTDLFEEATGSNGLLFDVPAAPGEAIGMDVSPRIVHRARCSATGDAAYVVCDARCLPFATDSLALIFSPSTLDHFSNAADLGRSLREIQRVLLPEGILILTLDNRHNLSDRVLRLIGRLGWIPFYIGRSYSIREMGRELANAGFRVEETTTLVQHPRLAGVALTWVTQRLGWRWLQSGVRRSFLYAERLEQTRLKLVTGCFVAARAVPLGAKAALGARGTPLPDENQRLERPPHFDG